MKPSDYEPDEHGRRFKVRLEAPDGLFYEVWTITNPEEICGECGQHEAQMIVDALEEQAVAEYWEKAADAREELNDPAK